MRPAFIRGRRGSARASLLADEQGIALIMALGIMLVLTIALTTVAFLTTHGTQDAQRTNAGQRAYALAEAGVNDAISILDAGYPALFPGNQCLLHDPGSPSNGVLPGVAYSATTCSNPTSTCSSNWAFQVVPDSVNRPNDTFCYWGALRGQVPGISGPAWVVRSTGSVPNPTGPFTAPVTRTLTVELPITTPKTVPGTSILSWVYSGGDFNITNTGSISSPLFVNGNVLVTTAQAEIDGPLYAVGNVEFTQGTGQGSYESLKGSNCPPNPAISPYPGCINIGGNLKFDDKQDTAGTNSQKIPDFHIVGSCNYAGANGPQSPCGTANANAPTPWTSENIFATIHDNSLAAPPFQPLVPYTNASCSVGTNLCLDFPDWYNAASPGPKSGCTTFSGTPPVFENNTTPLDGSVPTVNLTPANQPYSCTSAEGGVLSWDGSSNLTVLGTIFIDGSATVSPPPNQPVQYNRNGGFGAIWLAGTFSMSNNQNLCAVVSGNTCNFNSWDPTKNAIGFVANGNSGGYGMTFNSAACQCIVEATNGINIQQSSNIQGPIISVNGPINAAQSGNLTFPPVAFPQGSLNLKPPLAYLMLPTQYSGG